MNKKFFKQFAIALALFLAGYFSFNTQLFTGFGKVSAVPAQSVMGLG